MAAESSLALWLALADVAVLASAGAGWLMMRRTRPASSLDVKAAFGVLDRSISRYVPDLEKGYTWEEAFERLKESGIKADWDAMSQRLTDYEAFRYGGKDEPKAGQGEVVSLAAKLRRGVVGKGTKAKGTRPS